MFLDVVIVVFFLLGFILVWLNLHPQGPAEQFCDEILQKIKETDPQHYDLIYSKRTQLAHLIRETRAEEAAFGYGILNRPQLALIRNNKKEGILCDFCHCCSNIGVIDINS